MDNENKDWTDERLLRSRLLLGDAVMKRLREARGIVFGTGGVGSWCVEALVRTGVKHLTIVDSDRVCASNINRQLMATTRTVGRPKVEVLRERLLEIAPDAEIVARQEVFNEQTAASFQLESYDFIVDAIDSLRDKALLILLATSTKASFVSSMGAALKIDPTRIQMAEFWKVKGCPLARALRQRFKKEKTFPSRKFKCVFSDEMGKNKFLLPSSAEHANGSLLHITGIFGFMLAGEMMRDLCKGVEEPQDQKEENDK
ncbi:MAG: tRNA threonylcarbamoyladenosine dehydratase [Prevotella sp.]|nr:tRNA threonylcarbamoyladenosine dehydratase [Prevotella sp.]